MPGGATTKRAPGRWNVGSISGERLVPEESAEIAWLSPERFRALVHQVGAESEYGSQNDVKRPDVVVVEKELALDRRATRRRMVPGVALGVVGLVTVGIEFALLPAFASNFLLLLVPTVVGALLLASGFTLAAQSEWQSEVVRVRLEPSSVRSGPSSGMPRLSRAPLRLRIYSGRVASSTTSTKSGAFRTLVRRLPDPGTGGTSARRFADRLVALAPLEAAKERPPPAGGPVGGARGSGDPNLVPQESLSERPTWYPYPERFNTIRAIILIVPMMLLIWGPMLLLLPWDYQHASLTGSSSPIQGIPNEGWSPTGSTPGELIWATYDSVSDARVSGVPITFAVCPIGSDAIGTSTCHTPLDGTNGADFGDLSVSIPNGWHLVLSENTSALCGPCKSSVSLGSPSMALGLAMTSVGLAVAVPGALYWLRLRARVRSTWPA